MEKLEPESQHLAEREPHIPLISTEEQRFIEDTGGEYSGYIRSSDGRKNYEQFRVSRCARYDEDQRAVVEIYIATEAIARDGEKEMRGPEDIVGFSTMIGQLARTGEELKRPEILVVHHADFKRKRMTATDFQNLARELYKLASDRASSSGQSQLLATLKNYLRSEGWEEGREP